MGQQCFLGCHIELPDGIFGHIDDLAKAKQAWLAFKQVIEGIGLSSDFRDEISDSDQKERTPSTTGVRRQGRPPGSKNRATKLPREIAQPIRPSPQPVSALDMEDEDVEAAE